MKKQSILLLAILVSTLYINAQETHNALYDKALSFEKSVQLDSAAYYFQKAFDAIADSTNWERKIMCFDKIGENLRKLDKYQDALTAYETAIELGKNKLPTAHLLMANLYLGIGIIHFNKNDFEKAEYFYDEALKIRKEQLGSDHVLTAEIISSIAGLLLQRRKYAEAESHFRTVLDVRIRNYGKHHLLVGKSYHNLGLAVEDLGRFIEANDLHHKALEIFLAQKNDRYHASFPYNSIANNYYYSGLYNNAIKFYEKSLSIRKSYLPEEHRLIADLYNNIGNSYRLLGNYGEALSYHKRAIDIRTKVFNANHLSVAQSCNSIGAVYVEQQKLDTALEYLNRSVDIILTHLNGEQHPVLANSYNNIGTVYRDMENMDKALEYYQRSLDIRIDFDMGMHLITATNYNNLAIIYKRENDIPTAERYFQNALDIYFHHFGTLYYQEAGVAYGNLSQIYFDNKEWDKNLSYIQKSIACAAKHVDPDDLEQNPKLENIVDKKNMPLFLDAKAQSFYHYYLEDRDYDKLNLSIETDLLNIRLIEQTLSGIQDIGTKQFIRTELDAVFERAIQTAFELNTQFPQDNYSNIAHTLLEKSKAFQLIEHLNQVNANKFANVPDSLIEKESNLRAYSTYYHKKVWLFELDTIKLNRQISKTADQAAKNDLLIQLEKTVNETNLYQSYLLNTQRELTNILQTMENEYPDYYALKYDFSVPSVEAVQKKLLGSDTREKNTAVLQYFIGEERIYSSAITKDSIIFHQFEIPSHFNSLVSEFRSSLISKNFLDSLSIVERYSDSALELHDLLISKVIQKLNSDINKLIIIPDGILHHVQFDMLLTKAVYTNNFDHLDCSTFDFLFNDYTISQAYSVRKLMDAIEQQKDNNTANKKLDFCGIEPIYGARNTTNLTTTTDSIFYDFVEKGIPSLSNELDQVAQLFKRKNLLTGKDATESNFLNIINQFTFKIMHLSSHGLINDQYPEYSKLILSFTNFENPTLDDCIEVAELYNMEIPAELMVLSACNTGYGENILSGEGIISIARGVAFAGCPSIVMSMWELEGRSNTVLMTNFYTNILSGMPPDEALRTAKLSYLSDQNLSRYDLIPYRWASTVPIGLMQPIFDQ